VIQRYYLGCPGWGLKSWVGRLFPPPVTIDHVLADERLGISDYSVEDLPGSDHRAVFAALVVPPRAGG